MVNSLLRFLPALLFAVTGSMALVYEKDYWEAASWFSFALAVLVPAIPTASGKAKNQIRVLSIVLVLTGLLLLVLRLFGILPEPVRPIPII